jgi:hypothetical protein
MGVGQMLMGVGRMFTAAVAVAQMAMSRMGGLPKVGRRHHQVKKRRCRAVLSRFAKHVSLHHWEGATV